MYKSKVKIGDSVKIDLGLVEEATPFGYIIVTPKMEELKGTVCIVESIDEDGFPVINGHCFTNNMFRKVKSTSNKTPKVTKKVKALKKIDKVLKAKPKPFFLSSEEVEILSGTLKKGVTPVQPPFAMIKSADGLTLILDCVPYNVANTHPNYDKIVKAIQEKRYSDITNLVNLSSAIEAFGKGTLEVKDGVVKFNGEQLHGCIVDTILGLISEGFDMKPMVRFLENLNKNPSYRAVQELYGFLEYGKLPITEDGYFLTYKKVRQDYKDIHSGTFDNSVGAICEMPRHKVDDNSSNTCSAGLHVCSYEYTKHFGNSDSRLVLCKVNPADVVSIPVDYNNTKMRTCKYEVVADVTGLGDTLNGVAVYK